MKIEISWGLRLDIELSRIQRNSIRNTFILNFSFLARWIFVRNFRSDCSPDFQSYAQTVSLGDMAQKNISTVEIQRFQWIYTYVSKYGLLYESLDFSNLIPRLLIRMNLNSRVCKADYEFTNQIRQGNNRLKPNWDDFSGNYSAQFKKLRCNSCFVTKGAKEAYSW